VWQTDRTVRKKIWEDIDKRDNKGGKEKNSELTKQGGGALCPIPVVLLDYPTLILC
jgi:hypothetical protein